MKFFIFLVGLQVMFLTRGEKSKNSCEKEGDSGCIEEELINVVKNIDKEVLRLYRDKPTGKFEFSSYRIYLYTNTTKEKDSVSPNISFIDFEECEKILKEKENINPEDPLLIFQVILERKNEISNQVEYSIYSQKGKKLNLSFCQNETVSVKLPVNRKFSNIFSFDTEQNNLEYNFYDSSDPFYNDVCTRYTTEYNTDMTLEDRKRNFFPNKSFCESNCMLEKIDYKTKKIECQCKTKLFISDELSEFLPQNKDDSFKKVRTNSNLNVIRCYKYAFSKEVLKNIGSWVMFILLLCQIALNIAHIGYGIKTLTSSINDILAKKFAIESEEGLCDSPLGENQISSENTVTKPQIILTIKTNATSVQESEDKDQKGTTTFPPKKRGTSKSLKKRVESYYKKYFRSKFVQNHSTKSLNLKMERNSDKNLTRRSITSQETKKGMMFQSTQSLRVESNAGLQEPVVKKVPQQIKDINEFIKTSKTLKESKIKSEYSEEELNDLNYDKALLADKRTYMEIYISILKHEQQLISTFFLSSDLNPKLLKISLFMFRIIMYLFFNTLFYVDSSLSHYYDNKGSYDFFYNFPKSIFSTIACAIMIFFLSPLVYSQNDIQKIKDEKKQSLAKKASKKFIWVFKAKVLFYFSFIFIFTLFFWYYISCFCGVFVNIQKFLILDAFISFMIEMVYPILFCFICAGVRCYGLKAQSQICFKISQILQLIA